MKSESHRSIGVAVPNGHRVLILEPVLEAILDYSEQDLRCELGGFLTGVVGGGLQEDDPFVEIRHFLPAVDARHRAASLTFTHDTWAAMTREVERCHPEECLVGWQHTHPGFGVFLSGYDLFIHRHFFREPWHVALVVDPRQHELGFFQWNRGEVVDCGFIVRSTNA